MLSLRSCVLFYVLYVLLVALCDLLCQDETQQIHNSATQEQMPNQTKPTVHGQGPAPVVWKPFRTINFTAQDAVKQIIECQTTRVGGRLVFVEQHGCYDSANLLRLNRHNCNTIHLNAQHTVLHSRERDVNVELRELLQAVDCLRPAMQYVLDVWVVLSVQNLRFNKSQDLN